MANSHNDHWSDRPWIYWVGLGALGTLIAAFEIDWGEVTPAWVQAIGSIVAIVAAVIIGHRNHRHSERVFEETRRRDDTDRRLKARSLAISLYVDLLEMRKKLSGVKASDGSIKWEPLGIPPVLNESVERLYLLGNAGLHIQNFLAATRSLNMLASTKSRTLEGIKSFEILLGVMEKTLADAIRLIGPIHDGEEKSSLSPEPV